MIAVWLMISIGIMGVPHQVPMKDVSTCVRYAMALNDTPEVYTRCWVERVKWAR